MSDLETFLNRQLAILLTQNGIPSKHEQRRGRWQIDVVAEVEGLRVVLEAETGFHKKAQAIKDADARLHQRLATVVFAVCYTEGTTEDTLATTPVTWTVRTKPDEASGDWSVGSVAQLAHAVQQAPNSLNGADVAARLLSDGLDQAVQLLSASARKELAKALDLPETKPSGRPLTDGWFVAAKRGMLVVATAMLFHHRVQSHLPEDRPFGFVGEWPPANMASCADASAIIDAFREAWRGILAVDYRPVFETGRAALTALSSDPDTALAVRGLTRVVAQISERVVGLRHDLLGRVFHFVLDTARYDGSYYTSTAAAVLLTSLALRPDDVDWSDPNAIANLRISDPACGTGTLLMAAAERIRDLRNSVGKLDPADEEALGLMLVEDVLHGYDINLSATHMAASTLGMLSPSTQFQRINVHRVLLGVFDNVPYLGSLDFLIGRPRLGAWPSVSQQVETEVGMAEPPPPMDLVIMNPPFTRDSLRHNQFTHEEELAIKREEKKVVRTLERQHYQGLVVPIDHGAARLHSSGGAFTVLAEKLLKSEKGILALVLPAVVPTAPGNLALRKYLAQRLHIDTIVSSHDPNRIFFSENTSIGEVLLVCRRWDGNGPKPPTRVVNLARNPATPVAALDTANRIENAWTADSPSPLDFTVQAVDAQRIANGDWSAVNFLSPFLTESCRKLTEPDAYAVGVAPLSTLADIGPAGQRIRDAYTYSPLPTASGRRALWRHRTDVTQSMLAQTDVYIEPKAAKRNQADSYWAQRSDMLLPHKLRLNLARVAAVTLPEQTVGSLWTPCRPHDPALTKALCLYLNSTPGLLTILGRKDNRIPSYPSFSLDTLRTLPVPNFAEVGSAEIDLLSNWFDLLKGETLQPFPQMHADPVRKQIDDAVCTALGLDAAWVANVRQALVREPSVTDGGPADESGDGEENAEGE